MFLVNRNYTTESLKDPFGDIFNDIFSMTNVSFPPYNIVSVNKKQFVIELAVAGFKKDEITVSFENDLLTIAGKKSKVEDTVKYIHHGIAYRDFIRRFTLSSDVKITDVVYEDGMLFINLVRIEPEDKKSMLIPIK